MITSISMVAEWVGEALAVVVVAGGVGSARVVSGGCRVVAMSGGSFSFFFFLVSYI